MPQYEPDPKTLERVKNDFVFHPVNELRDQARRYGHMRERCLELAMYILENTPASREQSLALTNLEQVMFWANGAIARNEK